MTSTISSTVLKMAVAPRALDDAGGGPSGRDRLEQVAEQFEALFVQSILSSARSAQLADPILKSEGMETFTSMLDGEYASALSQREALGIADALVAQFRHRVASGED